MKFLLKIVILLKLFVLIFIFLYKITIADNSNQSYDKILVNNILSTKTTVFDETNTLNDTDKEQLKSKIEEIRKKYTVEVLLILINETKGIDISELSVKVGQGVGVGKSDKDNGLVILIAKNEKKWNISTGYGLEGVLPDLIVNKIGQKNFEVFKQEKYFEGINGTLNDIEKYISGDKSIISKQNSSSEDFNYIYIIEFIFVAIFSSAYIRKFVEKKEYKKAFYRFILTYVSFIPIIFLIIGLEGIFINIFVWFLAGVIGVFGKNSHNNSDNGGFGGGFGGGSSGGGFGGGGFGGGGSSGKW